VIAPFPSNVPHFSFQYFSLFPSKFAKFAQFAVNSPFQLFSFFFKPFPFQFFSVSVFQHFSPTPFSISAF